jgi:hypothetical protein
VISPLVGSSWRGRSLGSNPAPEENIMRTGRTLSEVAAEIERQARTKQDYIADTRQLRLAEDGQTLALDGHGRFQTKDLARTQIGAHTGIPVPYMRRLQAEAPELLCDSAWKIDPGRGVIGVQL